MVQARKKRTYTKHQARAGGDGATDAPGSRSSATKAVAFRPSPNGISLASASKRQLSGRRLRRSRLMSLGGLPRRLPVASERWCSSPTRTVERFGLVAMVKSGSSSGSWVDNAWSGSRRIVPSYVWPSGRRFRASSGFPLTKRLVPFARQERPLAGRRGDFGALVSFASGSEPTRATCPTPYTRPCCPSPGSPAT